MPVDFERQYWDSRYQRGGNSGKGSYGDEGSEKVCAIAKLCQHQGIDSILDIGCGDMSLGARLVTAIKPRKYLGLDVSPVIIEKDARRFPSLSFVVIDNCTFSYPADLVLCIDVLFHVKDDADYSALLGSIKRSFTKMAIVSNYHTSLEQNLPNSHMARRVFKPDAIGPVIDQIRLLSNPEKSLYCYRKEP